MVPLAATHRGRTSAGHDFVSDGSLLILAELAILSPFEGYSQIPSAVLDALVSRPPFCWCPLHALAPSRRRADVFWAPGDVALSDRYLGPLRALNRPIDLGPSGPKDPVLLKEGDRVIGVLMPLDYPPEGPLAAPELRRAEPDPAPPPPPAAWSPPPQQQPAARPISPQKAAPWPPEGEVPVEEALAGAHRNGLLLDMDLAAFHAVLGELHARPMTRVDAADVLEVIAFVAAPRPPAAAAPPPVAPSVAARPAAPPRPPPPAAAVPPPVAPQAPASPASPPPASPLHLERFEIAARKIVAAAQALADQRGHVNTEPLHIAVRLVERDIDPARARVSLQIAEQSLARLPRAPAGEPSYLSPATLELLKEVDRLAEGRPVAIPDLWRAIRRHRGSSAAIVLEAASPD